MLTLYYVSSLKKAGFHAIDELVEHRWFNTILEEIEWSNKFLHVLLVDIVVFPNLLFKELIEYWEFVCKISPIIPGNLSHRVVIPRNHCCRPRTLIDK